MTSSAPAASPLFVQPLQPIATAVLTEHKPQSKVWTHGNQWWTVLANGSGTWIWRLDGVQWTPVLKLTGSQLLADVKEVGDAAHILLQNGAASQLASVEYVHGAPGTYQLWSARPTLANLALSPDDETATIDMDTTGRLWVASDAVTTIEVRHSAYPYTAWSEPITLASGVSIDDISVVTALPNHTIGVMWSNQITKRFGFRTHIDGDALDRWRAMYEVATKNGTRPIVVLNEVQGRLLVMYEAGEIVYRESAISPIAFGPKQPLVLGENATSTKQNWTRELVVIADGNGVLLSTSPRPKETLLVNAGPDQTTGLIGPLTLRGSVTELGLRKPSGTVTATWTQVSGPGVVSLGNASIANTTASFSMPGSYVLRLTARQADWAVSDEVTVTVERTGSLSLQDGAFPTPDYTGTRDTFITGPAKTTAKKAKLKTNGSATALLSSGVPDNASLLKWDLSSIPAGTTIKSA
ncbi:MAG: hypothetical protein HY000_11265, partial [Planctomycetes bacterium]|nr:hypothetical protein [Planctomycetota bacterium]